MMNSSHSEWLRESRQAIPKAIKEVHDELSQLRGQIDVLSDNVLSRSVEEVDEVISLLGNDTKKMLVAAKEVGSIVFTPGLGVSPPIACVPREAGRSANKRDIARLRHCVQELRKHGLVIGSFERSSSSVFTITNRGYEVLDRIENKETPATELSDVNLPCE